MTPALQNVRRLVEWSRQNHNSASGGPSPIQSVGILGAGMMGTAIAAAHVAFQLPIVISDVNEAALGNAMAAISAELPTTARLQMQDESKLVRTTADATEVARCDLVLESIVETLSTKQQLYSQLQPHVASHTIVATNTSTIPIARLAAGMADPSRFCGIHFFHPVRERPLVEIVRGPETGDSTIAAAVAHVQRIGRMPIVVCDGPGFLVNRLLFPFLGEALALLREGVAAEAIEDAATTFGMAIGPLRLMDEIGLDTTLQAGWVLAAAFPERIVSSPLLVSLVKAGRLGQKSGAGFYSYGGLARPAATGVIDAAAEKLIARWIEKPNSPSGESIAFRLMAPMLLEAARILEEGKVADARSIDLAVIFGLGFPAEKGGLLWWADTVGAEEIVAMLPSYSTMEGRNQPPPLLLALAKSHGRFYDSLFEQLT
jgi:3-hydroxyacyl-CoA dehydrogenase